MYAKIEVLMQDNYSKSSIKDKAIQAAKIKALGEEFGYAIVQGINTQTTNTSGDQVITSTSINEISNTLVKGEWVRDATGYPITRFTIRDKGNEQEIWLVCEVKGVAREIQEVQVNFLTYPYNCQEPEKCNDGAFKNNDSMYLYFKSPVSGYLSVFMVEQGLVYRLLPYAKMNAPYESHVPVKADQDYFLFSPEHRDYFEGFPLVDEYGLVTYSSQEPLSNLLYVVFSTKPYNKPLLKEENGIKYTELNDFQDWINKNRGLDESFQIKKIGIVVNN